MQVGNYIIREGVWKIVTASAVQKIYNKQREESTFAWQEE